MDKYIIFEGEPVKLAVADFFGYVRYEELSELEQRGLKTNSLRFPHVRDYYAQTNLYRFPFPEEDNQLDDYLINGNRKLNKTYFVPELDSWFLVTHSKIHVCLHRQDNREKTMMVEIPCPVQVQFGNKVQDDQRKGILIKGERVDAQTGKKRTIFSCPWCGALFSCNEKELTLIKDKLLSGNHYEQLLATRLFSNSH